MLLSEKYRPRTWSEVVGQAKAVKTLQALGQRNGFGGRAYFISGASGSGKTTLARLIAAEVADTFATEEMDASELTADKVRQIDAGLSQYGWGAKGGKAYIVNEVHGLSAPMVRRLLCLLEPDKGGLPNHVVFIFTTTTDGLDLFADNLDAHPLLSRCTCITLGRRDLAKPFAERVKESFQAENMDGQPIEWYVRLARDCKNNMRAMYELGERRLIDAD